MKRPWLALCLIAVIAVISGIGVHREVRLAMDRSLASFRATLPPGSTFVYSSIKPAILARGAKLKNVLLRSGTTTVRASWISIGHPQALKDGSLYIAKLTARDLSVETKTTSIKTASLFFRHLTVPPITIERNGRPVVDLPHTMFDHGTVGQLSFQRFTTPRGKAGSTPAMVGSAASLDVRGYTPIAKAMLSLQDGTLTLFSAGYKVDKVLDEKFDLSEVRFTMRDLQMHDAKLSRLVSFFQEGPDYFSRARLGQEDDLPPFEASSSKLEDLHIMTPGITIGFDHLYHTRHTENAAIAQTSDITGLHVRSPKLHPHVHLDGDGSSLHLRTVVTGGTTATIEDFSLAASIPNTGNFALSGNLTFPGVLMTADRDGPITTRKNLLDHMHVARLSFTTQGDRIIDTGLQLLARSASAREPSSHTVTPSEMRSIIVMGAARDLAPYQDLTALPGYLESPRNRKLTVTFEPDAPLPLSTILAAAREPSSPLLLKAMKAEIR